MLHGKFDTYYWGLYNAHQMMDADIDLFALTFSPQVDPMKDVKVILDIVGTVFACINAGAFNICEFLVHPMSKHALTPSKF
jgi:hypothetical protein